MSLHSKSSGTAPLAWWLPRLSAATTSLSFVKLRMTTVPANLGHGWLRDYREKRQRNFSQRGLLMSHELDLTITGWAKVYWVSLPLQTSSRAGLCGLTLRGGQLHKFFLLNRLGGSTPSLATIIPKDLAESRLALPIRSQSAIFRRDPVRFLATVMVKDLTSNCPSLSPLSVRFSLRRG
jgi:hypothetical protein